MRELYPGVATHVQSCCNAYGAPFELFNHGNNLGESKPLRAIEHAIARQAAEGGRFKWIFVGDDDTFFVLSNWLPFLEQYNPDEPHYIGGPGDPGWDDRFGRMYPRPPNLVDWCPIWRMTPGDWARVRQENPGFAYNETEYKYMRRGGDP